MKKFLFLAIALVMSVSAWADAYDFGNYVIKEVKACTQTIESGKWYVLSNVRKDGGNYATPTPVYDQGAGSAMKREPFGQTVRTIFTANRPASEVAKYLVRFDDHATISGTKCAQYGTGNYVAPLSANSDGTDVTTSASEAAGLLIYGATQTRYSYAGSPYTNAGVGINFSTGADNYGKRWDGNGAGYSVLVWGDGRITSDANNVWYVEEVELVDPTAENTYTITIYNAPIGGVKVTYKGEEYGQNDPITITGAFDPSEFSATPATGYHVEFEIEGEYLRVRYIQNTFPQVGKYIVTIENKEVGRHPFLFNSAEYSDDITLQGATDEHATVNGYIWEVTTDEAMHITAIKNAETGKGIKATNKCNGVMTTFDITAGVTNGYYNLINTTMISGGGHDRLNCANSDDWHNEAGLRAVTTWTGNHTDNDWRFNTVEYFGYRYDVVVTGLPAGTVGYAIYNGLRAADGGFYLPAGVITSGVTAKEVAGYSYEVNYGISTITVTYTQTATPVDVTYEIYVGDTKVGEKVISEYVGEGQHIMDWFSAQSAVEYVTVNSLHNDPVTAENGTTPIQVRTSYRPNMPFQTDGTLYTLALNRTPNLQIYVTGETINTMATTNANYTAPTYANQANYNWAIEGDWFNGFTLKNIGANKYVTFGTLAPSGDKPAATLVETPAEGGHFELRIKNTNQYYFRIMGTTNAAYISDNGGNNPYLTTWNSENNFNQSDAGAQFVFSAPLNIPEGNDWGAFETKLQQLQQYTFGDKLGQYAEVDLSGYYINSVSEALGLFADDLTAEAEENYDEDIEIMDLVLANLQLNMPQPNTLFRMKGHSSQKYVYADATSEVNHTSGNIGAANCLPMGDLAGNEATSIFFFDGDHLLSYQSANHTGLYVYQSGLNTNLSDASGLDTFEFFEGMTAGTYRIHTTKANSNLYDYHADNGRTNRWNSSDNARTCFDLEEVTTLPVTFKGAGKGYATIYSPVALEIPAEVTAYVGTEESEGTVKVNDIEDGIIPAKKGVVLYKESVESDTTIEFPITTGGESTSCFTGTLFTMAAENEDHPYVFSIAGAIPAPGFYNFVGATLAGFKAYYVAAGAPVQGFVLDFGGQTVGIEGLQTVAPVKGAFDLQGRRVNAATRGLFIQNGVKVIR